MTEHRHKSPSPVPAYIDSAGILYSDLVDDDNVDGNEGLDVLVDLRPEGRAIGKVIRTANDLASHVAESSPLAFITDDQAEQFTHAMIAWQMELTAKQDHVRGLERAVVEASLDARELAEKLKEAKALHKELVDELAEERENLEVLESNPPKVRG